MNLTYTATCARTGCLNHRKVAPINARPLDLVIPRVGPEHHPEIQIDIDAVWTTVARDRNTLKFEVVSLRLIDSGITRHNDELGLFRLK